MFLIYRELTVKGTNQFFPLFSHCLQWPVASERKQGCQYPAELTLRLGEGPDLLLFNRVMAGGVTGGKPAGREGDWTLKMGLAMPVFLPWLLWPQLSHL